MIYNVALTSVFRTNRFPRDLAVLRVRAPDGPVAGHPDDLESHRRAALAFAFSIISSIRSYP
jgi:hypothetical protein